MTIQHSSDRPVIVVTRAKDQADELISILKEKGAEVLHLPTIKLTRPDTWESCDNAIQRLASFDWCVFSSPNGVEFFSDRLLSTSGSFETLQRLRIAAVGERTRVALETRGIPVALVPAEYSAEGLCAAFERTDLQEKKVLIVQPRDAGDRLSRFMADAGAGVERAVAYKNTCPSISDLNEYETLMRRAQVDVFTFTSPSTFRNFIILCGQERFLDWLGRGAVIASIGKATTHAIREAGFPVRIQPDKSTMPDFARSILSYLHRN